MSRLHAPRAAALLLIALGLATFLGRQSEGGLRSFDDAYYAQKAVEQLQAGGSWVSTHGGTPRYDNPPLHFWATALAFRLFGVSRFAAVLMTGLFATGTLLLVHALGRRLLGDAPALTAGLVLLLPGFFMDYARRGMLDQTLVFFFTLALIALYLALVGARRGPWLALYGLALGAALLTKSVIGGLVVPTGVLWLSATRTGRRLLRRWELWLATAGGLALFGLWALMNWRHGGADFLQEHFGWLILGRAVRDAGESGPGFLLGYLKLLGGNTWPWVPFYLFGGWLAAREWRAERSGRAALLLVWALLPLAVMSLTRNQFLRYVLNVFPALALLTAWGLARLLERRGWLPRVNLALLGLATVVALAINFTDFAPKGATGLAPQSADVVALAPAVAAHTAPDARLLNLGLGTWDPRNALLFHTGRWLEDPLPDAAALAVRLTEEPGQPVLLSAEAQARLRRERPGLLRELGRAGHLVLATGGD